MSRLDGRLAFLVGAKRCLDRAYFRHRIFIRFTYHPCRNYGIYSWKLSRIYFSRSRKFLFSASFLPFFSFLPSPEGKSVHIFTFPLISSPIAFYGLRVSVLINLPSFFISVYLFFYVGFSYMRCRPRRS